MPPNRVPPKGRPTYADTRKLPRLQIKWHFSCQAYRDTMGRPLPSSSPDLSAPRLAIWAGANDIFFFSSISAAQSYIGLQSAGLAPLDTYPGGRIFTINSPSLSKMLHGSYAEELIRHQLQTFPDLLGALSGNWARVSSEVYNIDMRWLFEQLEYLAQPHAYGMAP